jgi:serine/threonine protein phosphatase PrpC
VSWQILGATVRGTSHERTGRPNQDAWYKRSSPNGDQVVLAVADGHGSERSFRSHVGAELAVRTAVGEGWRFLEARRDDAGRPDDDQWLNLDLALDNLAKHIVFRWEEKVHERWRRMPATEEELAEGAAQVPHGDPGPGLAQSAGVVYGTTLLVALATRSFLGFLQVGDGDILTVSDDGTVEWAIERDRRFLGNQTASLAMPDASKQFRTRCWPSRRELPALVLIATDGYANSYSDDEAFRMVAGGYLQQIRESGVKAISGSLRTWLREVTAGGSGDDITVGLMIRGAGVHGCLPDRVEQPPDGPEDRP